MNLKHLFFFFFKDSNETKCELFELLLRDIGHMYKKRSASEMVGKLV